MTDNAFDKMNVLAVDDNRTNLHILQVFLKKLGHQVVIAENGEEAVARFREHQPDLILLDIMMPVMDGFEAARQIKAMTQEKWVPIIFLSALNRDENLVEGLQAGADDYLTKPLNFVVLEAKLRSVQRSLALQKVSIDALRRVKAISDNVLDAIVTINTCGQIISVNRACERIFGWTAEAMIGKNVSMLMPEPYHSEHPGYIDRYLSQQGGSLMGIYREVTALRRDGSVFPATIGITETTHDDERTFIGVIRDISQQKAIEQQLRDNATLLQRYYDQTHNEQQLALKLMEKQLHRPGLRDPRLRYKVTATEHFSGDIVAAARAPSGRFYALLADATGHGLPAALSVLPLLALFYRMTRLNRSVREIILEINQQLREAMPIGRFVAATVVGLDDDLRSGEIWVGGAPEALLIAPDGTISQRFPSRNLALGIVDSSETDGAPEAFQWTSGSQLLMYSDGLLEASNEHGEQFGEAGIARALASSAPETRFSALDEALASHLGSMSADDDVSLMMLNCP